VRRRCTFLSFMCRRNYIAASEAGQRKPLREIVGAFQFLGLQNNGP
jgi:hypothetical protein